MEQDITKYLKERRLELGLTMKQVAKKVGVSEGTISRWESGNISNMRRDRIAAYAKALDIEPSVIMGMREPTVIDLSESYNAMLNVFGRISSCLEYLSEDDINEIEHLIEYKANKNKKAIMTIGCDTGNVKPVELPNFIKKTLAEQEQKKNGK